MGALGPEAHTLEQAIPGRQAEAGGLLAGERAPRQLKRKVREPEGLPAAAPGGDGSAPASGTPAAKRFSSPGSAGAACSAGDAPRVSVPPDSAGAAGVNEGVPPASDQQGGALVGSAAPDPGDAPCDGTRLDDALRASAGARPDSMHLDGAAPECEVAPPASMHPTSTAAEPAIAPPTSLRPLDAAPDPQGAPRVSMQRGSGAPPLRTEGGAAALGGAEGLRPGSGHAALPQVPALGARTDPAAAPPLPLFHGAGGDGADIDPNPGLQPAGALPTSSMEWLGAGTALNQGAQTCWAGQEAVHAAAHGLPGLGPCAGFGGLAGASPAPAPLPRAAAAWGLGVGGDRGVGLMQQTGFGMPCMADMAPLGPWPLSLALPMAHPGFGPGFGLGVPPWQAEAPLCAANMAEAGARAAKWHAASRLGAGPTQQELHLQQLRQQHAWSAQAAQAAGAWGAQGPATLCPYPYSGEVGTVPNGWHAAAPGAAAQPAPGPALLGNGSPLDPAGAPWCGAGPLKPPYPTLPQPQVGGHSSGSAHSGAGPSSGLGLGAAAPPPGSAWSEGDAWNQFLLPRTSPCKARAG